MTIVDVNVLLYAQDSQSKHHAEARLWFEHLLSESLQVGFAWVVLHGFIRIATNPRVLEQPLSMQHACRIVSSWVERSNALILIPGPRHWSILQDLLIKGQARTELVTDAHLAALAIEYGATLASTDRDFTRFPGLQFLPLFGGHGDTLPHGGA